jgi:hypothetical protein
MPKEPEHGLDVLLHIDVAGWLAYGCAKPGKQGFVHVLHTFVHNAAKPTLQPASPADGLAYSDRPQTAGLLASLWLDPGMSLRRPRPTSSPTRYQGAPNDGI